MQPRNRGNANEARYGILPQFLTATVVGLELTHPFEPVGATPCTLLGLDGHQRNAVHQQANIHPHLLNCILVCDDETIVPNIVEIYETDGAVFSVDGDSHTIAKLIEEVFVAFYRYRVTQVVEQRFHCRLCSLLVDAVQRLHPFHQYRLNERIGLQMIIGFQVLHHAVFPAQLGEPFGDFGSYGLVFVKLTHKLLNINIIPFIRIIKKIL